MANINPKDFAKKLKELSEQIVKEVTNTQFMLELGGKASNLIFKRTRLGYGVSQQGSDKERLKPLSDSYKKVRKAHPQSTNTSPAKSNLTRTGEMLDAIQPIKTAIGSVTIGLKDSINSNKAQWNTEKGRPFMNLSSAEMKQIQNFLRDKINSILDKLDK